MKNPNALIAMAYVSENGNNPHAVFCEYIKYCIFSNSSDTMTLEYVRNAVGEEFGIYLPYNIAVSCLNTISADGLVIVRDHQITRTGAFDTNEFDISRSKYRETENALIQELIRYVAAYGKEWTPEEARDYLIKVLDRNGTAYDIFIHGKPIASKEAVQRVTPEELDALIPDEEVQPDEENKGPLFTDDLFVGKFVSELLSGDSIYKEYLRQICEGIMLCVGAYQVPSAGADVAFPQIRGTEFFFDTKLLLRYAGCAGQAAVNAVRELVKMIQDEGGIICYYPHTQEEIERAFDEAIGLIKNHNVPYDDEMRIYAASINNSIATLSLKKAEIFAELTRANIYLRQITSFTDKEILQFGYDRSDFIIYMRGRLHWPDTTIKNDAMSIWETHMRRQGRYSEYCGTNERLPVFVTNNSRLVAITLGYRNDKPHINAISGWKVNRLPVITDIRLTCRLWSPSKQSERLSLLYLAANAVAAQRPTRRYVNSIRQLATEFEKQSPEYSHVSLSEYFDDNVTEAVLTTIQGLEENLNLGTFASSIAEVAEFKAKEQEQQTRNVAAERDALSFSYSKQTENLISDAIDSYKNKLGLLAVPLQLAFQWKPIVLVLIFLISSCVSIWSSNWNGGLVLVLGIALVLLEHWLTSNVVLKFLLEKLLPFVERLYTLKTEACLRSSELPYKNEIVEKTLEETTLLQKARRIVNQ